MSTNFIEAASWPDDIKFNGAKYWNHWHYVSRPINFEGLSVRNSIPKVNALYAINTTL